MPCEENSIELNGHCRIVNHGQRMRIVVLQIETFTATFVDDRDAALIVWLMDYHSRCGLRQAALEHQAVALIDP